MTSLARAIAPKTSPPDQLVTRNGYDRFPALKELWPELLIETVDNCVETGHFQPMVDSAAIVDTHDEYFDVSGVIVPDDPAVITSGIRRALRENRFEAKEIRQIPNIICPGDNVLEIGAGIGVVSTLISREKRVSSVIAIEANPMLMGYMEELHRINRVRKVRRMNAVLTTGRKKTATFYLREDFWMGSLMDGPNPWVRKVEVPTINFNRLLRDEAIDLIVCDVEGAEAFLFERADLSRVDRVFMEVHDHITGLSGVSKIFATLGRKGFVYDPRHSEGSVILFRRLGDKDIIRPYDG